MANHVIMNGFVYLYAQKLDWHDTTQKKSYAFMPKVVA